MEQNSNLRVAVAQLGFRMHYGVPRILHAAGILETLYTDLYLGKWPWKALANPGISRIIPRKARILLSRRNSLPSAKIEAFQRFGAKMLWRHKTTSLSERWKTHLWAGDEFNRLIIKVGLGRANCVYGFRIASLGLFEHAAKSGVHRILDQCAAPTLIEDEITQQEYSSWRGWEDQPVREHVKAFAQRERAEWQLSDLILCPSEFVKRGLEAMGVPSEKCRIVPYGVSMQSPMLAKRRPSKPLKVLFVGQVRLLKGIPYLLDAMRQFSPNEVVCRIVGSIKVSRERLDAYAPPNVSFIGSVPRTEVNEHYAWADIFCLPSLCEGSATVVYEALVRGLPVITTANSGSIIDEESKRNFIVPTGNSQAIADAIRTIARNYQSAADSSEAADLARKASFESYSSRLLETLETLR